MSRDTYTTEITLTVPAGRHCARVTYSCRFLIGMGNHPGYYCFLIPESDWGTYGEIRKHPDCPSLNQIPKPKKGESLAVMERLARFKALMGESRP